jgi:hypothetical protein
MTAMIEAQMGGRGRDLAARMARAEREMIEVTRMAEEVILVRRLAREVVETAVAEVLAELESTRRVALSYPGPHPALRHYFWGL